MPELPEVETIRRGLQPLVTGRRVVQVTVRDRRLRWPIAPKALDRLRGARLTGVRRRSKYLLLDTDAGVTLLMHLGMSGRIWVSESARPARPHEHVVFGLDDGRDIRFADPRRFGMVDLVPDERLEEHPRLRGLGPEPIDDDAVAGDPASGDAYARAAAAATAAEALAERFWRVTRGRKKPVKNFLMDTRAVAGVGNIYACESLHRAAIRPSRAVQRLNRDDWSRLVKAVRVVLGEAIEAGGTTLRDFFNAEEEAGYFAVRLRVYDREGKACPRCRAVVRRRVMAGRSTFYCPACQR
ncbi:MAG TPA: bifunctional DNA-formamidopyrimidine glycosylase/DNA-(apurinic or apyrimidinic site) lyase [Candidatus Polarisedimenticolia bacterium]|nr:bifunctional DNA-formamidopyrimidine glycosylase/DNA-(apurinic or apyrimidinic site) lyase [Candidatus Polarisedimenticolia bacterium]